MKSHVVLSLRLPPELHEQLVNSASARFPRNSLNSEILERLRFSFKEELEQFEPFDPEEIQRRLEDTQRRLAALERIIYGEDK
jgi:hypothetical protein